MRWRRRRGFGHQPIAAFQISLGNLGHRQGRSTHRCVVGLAPGRRQHVHAGESEDASKSRKEVIHVTPHRLQTRTLSASHCPCWSWRVRMFPRRRNFCRSVAGAGWFGLTGSLDRSRCRTAKGRRARSPGRGAGSFAKRRGKIQRLAGAERSSSCAPCRVPPAIPFGLYGTIVAWRGRDISDHFRLGALRVETLPDGRGPKFRYKNGLVAATPRR